MSCDFLSMKKCGILYEKRVWKKTTALKGFMKNMEITTRIYDSDGIESTIRKKGGVVYSDYELDKATSLIENEL